MTESEHEEGRGETTFVLSFITEYTSLWLTSSILRLRKLQEQEHNGQLMRHVAAKAKDSEKDETKAKEIAKEVSNGFCSIAELYMTDLCDEEEAERECEASVTRAVEADDSNPEAFQTKARLCIVKEQFEDAKVAANKSLSLWLPQFC